MKETEEEIYAAAQLFRFRPDPKQMMRLLNKEELHRYREPDRIKLEQQLENLRFKKQQLVEERKKKDHLKFIAERKQFSNQVKKFNIKIKKNKLKN
jgi:hypothetical protein